MIRSARALLLFATVFASYGVQWCVWRASGRKLFGQRWIWVHARNADRLATGFTRLRGVFIKFGQVLSVLAPFLPDAYGQRLGQLQDAVPARSFEEIKTRLVAAFGDRPLEAFQHFEQEPIAAASLAQVHRATTRDGKAVAVKVLYPNIEQLIEADLRVLRLVVPVVHRIFGFKRMLSVLDQVSEMLRHETDYENERRNVQRVARMFAHDNHIVVPSVHADMSSASVLVMSFESGIKMSDIDAMNAAGIDRNLIASRLVECYLSMLLEHRVFHADPHPGNFLVREDGTLVILDYGAVEDLNAPLVEGMKKVLMGGLSRNAGLVFQGVETMGFVAEGGDRDLLERVSREYLEVLSDVNITNYSRIDRNQIQKLSGFQQLRGRIRSVAGSLVYPDGYFYVERTITLLFGLVGQLSPDKGLLGIAAPLASKAMMRSYARRSAPPPAGSSDDPRRGELLE